MRLTNDRDGRVHARNTLLAYKVVIVLWLFVAFGALLEHYIVAALVSLGFACVVGSLREMSARLMGMEFPEFRSRPSSTLGEAERECRHDDHLM